MGLLATESANVSRGTLHLPSSVTVPMSLRVQMTSETSEPRNPRRGGGTWNLGMDSKKKSARLWRARRTWNLEPTGTYSQRGRGTRTAEPRKGLWRGVGEPALRGLYNALASSSLRHHQFREKRSARLRDKFATAVEHKRLAKRSSFFHPELFFSRARNFQTNRGARREAGKLPRSPCFKWRAGTPYPPVYQASGTDGLLSGRSKCARLCELHERATRPTR